MDEKVTELLDLTKKLLDHASEIVKSPFPHTSADLRKILYQIFLRVQLSEALKFGYGAYYSCKHGWGHGGIGAARSIYEILIDIIYINQDDSRKKERFTRFLDHYSEYFYGEMDRIIKLGQEVSQADQDKHKKTLEHLKKKYNSKHDQDIKSGTPKTEATPRYRRYHWAGHNLKEKTDAINQDQYHQFYKYLSDLSHVNARAMHDAIKERNEDQFTINLGLRPGPDHCDIVLIVVFPCIYWILEGFMEYFKIDHSHYPNLGKVEEDFKNLLKGRRQPK